MFAGLLLHNFRDVKKNAKLKYKKRQKYPNYL